MSSQITIPLLVALLLFVTIFLLPEICSGLYRLYRHCKSKLVKLPPLKPGQIWCEEDRKCYDPFKEPETFEVEIIDVKKNFKDEEYVKFRYLTKIRYLKHYSLNGGKLENVFVEKAMDFRDLFTKQKYI